MSNSTATATIQVMAVAHEMALKAMDDFPAGALVRIMPKSTDKISPPFNAVVRSGIFDLVTGRSGIWTMDGEWYPATRVQVR